MTSDNRSSRKPTGARFAARTEVQVSKSRTDIETTLRKAGASRIVTMDEPQEGLIGFCLADRLIKITAPLADGSSEQRRRTLWRALLLILKAKLEAVEQEISTVEQEFLAFVVLPGGITVGEAVEPQITSAYASGTMLKLLPDYSGGGCA